MSCANGAIHDVIVDLRPGSETYGHWQAFELSSTMSSPASPLKKAAARLVPERGTRPRRASRSNAVTFLPDKNAVEEWSVPVCGKSAYRRGSAALSSAYNRLRDALFVHAVNQGAGPIHDHGV